MKKGIMVLGHGSRSLDAQQVFNSIVRQFQALGYGNVKAAHMELCEPDIPTVLKAFAEEGIFDIYALPLFLYPGIHLKEDIPGLFQELMAANPRLRLTLLEPLKDDPLIVKILENRYLEAIK